MARILLADDDVELCGLLKNYIETDDLRVDCVHDGAAALALLLNHDIAPYDLLLLDVMMPERNGFEVLETVRAHGLGVPVLMLTARGDPLDKIAGLEGGADDYVCKPCDPRELAARIAAILRRCAASSKERAEANSTFRLGDVELNRASRMTLVSGRNVSMTDVEFRLLDALIRNAGRVVPTESLYMDVLDREYSGVDRSLSTHVCKLRQKLGAHPDGGVRIRASRCRGFIYLYPQPASNRGMTA